MAGLSRDQYRGKLRPHFAYDKADPDIYEKVEAHQATAFRNAHRLEKEYNEAGERFPERINPSTNVHKLVDLLNELRQLGEA